MPTAYLRRELQKEPLSAPSRSQIPYRCCDHGTMCGLVVAIARSTAWGLSTLAPAFAPVRASIDVGDLRDRD